MKELLDFWKYLIKLVLLGGLDVVCSGVGGLGVVVLGVVGAAVGGLGVLG